MEGISLDTHNYMNYHVFEAIMENGAFAFYEKRLYFSNIYKSIQNFTSMFLDFFQ